MTGNLAQADSAYMLGELLDRVEKIRIEANGLLDNETRGQKGQFMTPAPVARILAELFDDLDGHLSILDAGAGVGSLTAALVERALEYSNVSSIEATSWELEDVLAGKLSESFALCNMASSECGVDFNSNIHNVDFIKSAVDLLVAREKGEVEAPRFNKAILNPPYLKIAANSNERKLLRSAGVETGNLYSCFVSLALMLLDDGGELVAITPRSFCNGPYFNDFRRVLLDGNELSKIRVFESRTKAFKGDSVLQENVIFHIVKGKRQGTVQVSSCTCGNDKNPLLRNADFDEVVNPNNPDRFIHIVTNDEQASIAKRIGGMPCSLSDLGIEVSTGKVVDFRTRKNLRHDPEDGTVPLIYPMHFKNGLISWPVESKKKPNAIINNEFTEKQLIPNGTYVLTKRLTSKEENRRIVAALYTACVTDAAVVGFENKTNYFHEKGQPLAIDFAKGLWVYLNSKLVDDYFRQFNGHTQVNATDLRTLRFPDRDTLTEMGKKVQQFDQSLFDSLVESI